MELLVLVVIVALMAVFLWFRNIWLVFYASGRTQAIYLSVVIGVGLLAQRAGGEQIDRATVQWLVLAGALLFLWLYLRRRRRRAYRY